MPFCSLEELKQASNFELLGEATRLLGFLRATRQLPQEQKEALEEAIAKANVVFELIRKES